MVKSAQDIWDKMYTERTNMLWSKEEYLNSMHTYQMLLNKAEGIKVSKSIEETRLEPKARSISSENAIDLNLSSDQISRIK